MRQKDFKDFGAVLKKYGEITGVGGDDFNKNLEEVMAYGDDIHCKDGFVRDHIVDRLRAIAFVSIRRFVNKHREG